MQSKAITVAQYFAELPDDRKKAMQKLRNTIKKNLPIGFKEIISYGMVGYVVPHSIYPAGYHCNAKQPLPFIGLASQKNFIVVYHICIYANKELYNWFLKEYAKIATGKPDMGKSCIRFKKQENIPFELIGELCSKITVSEWIDIYEKNIKG